MLEELATEQAKARCTRRQVGCIIVTANGNYEIGGHNRIPAEMGLSCLAGQCPRGLLGYDAIPPFSSYSEGPGQCFAEHAERMALRLAKTFGVELTGATAHLTCAPCDDCTTALREAGVARVVIEL